MSRKSNRIRLLRKRRRKSTRLMKRSMRLTRRRKTNRKPKKQRKLKRTKKNPSKSNLRARKQRRQLSKPHFKRDKVQPIGTKDLICRLQRKQLKSGIRRLKRIWMDLIAESPIQ